MDKYKETFETWNNIASLYQEKFMDMDLYNHSYDFICTSLIKPNSKILELGCGPGNITKYLLTHRPDYVVYGIDISPNMIQLAKQNNPTANFAVMDTRHVNSLNEKFDAVIAGFCLPYLSQLECKKLIDSAYDLLNNEGLIYLSFVEGDHNHSTFKTSSGGRVYFYYHSLELLVAQLSEANFNVIKTFFVRYKGAENEEDLHTIVVARRNH